MGCDPNRVCWVLANYQDGDHLTRQSQEHYAENHGGEMKMCAHCYHVEDGEQCCGCGSTGITDREDYWYDPS